jgi:protein-disulfide isomerase
MKNYALASTLALASSLVLGGAAGCSQDNRVLESKIDTLTTSVNDLKAQVKAQGSQIQAAAAAGPQRPQQPQRPQRPQPDPTKAYAVPIDGDPFEGPADAKVTVIKAYDYMCPFCYKVKDTMEELRKKYGDDIRIVYKQFVVHPQAQIAHLAACAANKQGRFVQMDRLLWDKAFQTRQFDDAHIADLAKEAGCDSSRFAADMKSPDCQAWLQKDQAELTNFGVGATPSFFINGRFLSGAQPLPAFTQLVDEELKKANDRIAQGTPSSSYYKTWVIDRGEKKLEAPGAAVAH